MQHVLLRMAAACCVRAVAKAEAEQGRLLGNAAYKAGQLQEALNFSAAQAHPGDHLLLNNISLVQLKMGHVTEVRLRLPWYLCCWCSTHDALTTYNQRMLPSCFSKYEVWACCCLLWPHCCCLTPLGRRTLQRWLRWATAPPTPRPGCALVRPAKQQGAGSWLSCATAWL